MSQTPTTPHVNDVKPGALITFQYGPGSPQPGYADAEGIAYGWRRNLRFGDCLIVKMSDGRFETVSSFRDIGIGAYHWGVQPRKPVQKLPLP